jgi:hypothetical protein
MTVTCRRSAVSWAFGSVNAGCGDARTAPERSPDRAEHFQPIAECDAEVFEMLIGQVGENRQVNAVFSKAWPYSDMPSFSSQSAICCIASPPCDEPHAVTNDDI